MKLSVKKASTAVAVVATASLALSACGGGSSSSSSASSSLVIDTSFNLKTADPGRTYEPTGNLVAHAVYETLLTFNGSDLTKPVDGLASYSFNSDDTVLTLTMKGGHYFSDGSEVTVDDAVYSLQRVQGIKGNPSFLLDGLTIAKVDDKTLTITSPTAKPELPYILPNSALGIVQKKIVEANGGTTDENDGAEQYLNETSAGSGPYKIESFDAAKQVVLTANEKYSGTKPKYSRVVLRNVDGSTQKLNVEKGESQIALDLNPDQVSQVSGSNVKVVSEPSEEVFFLLLNQDPAVNKWTSNADFLKAVKLGIDYKKLVALGGDGAVHPGGVIPSIFVGALDSSKGLSTDVAAAKEALAKSGYDGSEITLNYPNDLTVEGLDFSIIAETIQAQLNDVGIKVKLAPAPVATELDAYRNGKETIGLWYWGPDFPHPSNYLVFAPGQLVGLRAMWSDGADANVTDLANAAQAATEADTQSAYEAYQTALNETGPFIPLIQPASNVVTSTSITSLETNPVWTVDLASIK